MTDLNASMAGVNASLDKLRQTVDKIGNPKDLKRRWQLISVVDGVYEPYAPPEGWAAGRLITELREWLEENDGDSDVHFEIHPAGEGGDG